MSQRYRLIPEEIQWKYGVSEEKKKGKTQRSQLRSVSVMFMSWALTDGFNYSAAALQFHCLSMAGQVFFRKIASLVYLLSSSPLNYCWYLFHQVSSLSLELWLSPFLPPHILSLNKHPLKKKKKSKENLCSPFLFDFPHVAVNHSPNTDGRPAWTLPPVAFPQDLFSLNIVTYFPEKKLYLSGVFSRSRNWLFLNPAILAGNSSLGTKHTWMEWPSVWLRNLTIEISLIWHLLKGWRWEETNPPMISDGKKDVYVKRKKNDSFPSLSSEMVLLCH